MKIREFSETLQKALVTKSGQDDRMHILASALQPTFKIKEGELAVLRFDEEAEELSFVWPKRLRTTGFIPLSVHNALSVRTLRDKKSYMDNHFASTRHAAIFEAVSLDNTADTFPIQKIMSAPLWQKERLLGVIQISRKGADTNQAGPDFTMAELKAFTEVAVAVAPYLLIE